MSMPVENTFALKSDEYVLARPRYPRALIEWLVVRAPGHGRAWDCATGNGQAAIDLAPYFAEVQATDVCAEQISQGLSVPNVHYSVRPAESTCFADRSFDLITVAQALHWFDFARFWVEVRRVARPGALFAAWGYAWFDCDSDVHAELVMPLRTLIDPFWAANNRLCGTVTRAKRSTSHSIGCQCHRSRSKNAGQSPS
jgi:ubiquinone/menaquinone biosynthesis C-methylase UbiE